MNENDGLNPLDEMGVSRRHIIALKEAYTQTNKLRSSERAQHLLELFQILQNYDHDRSSLIWEHD
jgi:hypothetical protein